MNDLKAAQSTVCIGSGGIIDDEVEWSSRTIGVWLEERSEDEFSM